MMLPWFSALVMELLVYVAAAVVVLLLYNNYFQRCHLPPGPPPLSLLGNALALIQKSDWSATFRKWRQ